MNGVCDRQRTCTQNHLRYSQVVFIIPRGQLVILHSAF